VANGEKENRKLDHMVGGGYSGHRYLLLQGAVFLLYLIPGLYRDGSSRVSLMAQVAESDGCSSMKKIVVIGPESTGKSSLTEQLANQFDCPMVEEYARSYIDQLNRPYEKEDLLEIARGQIHNEDRFQNMQAPFLFCDTDLRVIKIWSQVKYQDVHPWILYQIGQRKYHGYLLTDIDLPWEPDPQREHPRYRKQLFKMYQEELEMSGIPFTIISGSGDQRLQQSVKFISGID
jgi:nicotinamide riboside kinase